MAEHVIPVKWAFRPSAVILVLTLIVVMYGYIAACTSP